MDNKKLDKYLNKKKDKKKSKITYFKSLTIRVLICAILFLSCLIVCKSNNHYKQIIIDKVYNTNLSFTSVKKFYNKYLGGIFPLDKVGENTVSVFNEKLSYTNSSKYLDGVKLEVKESYVVPVIETGMVVYVGEKEGYDNVIIIQGMDGVDIWYGNMLTTSVKLYDYIEQGDILGEVNNNTLYLVYSQNGKFLDYEKYLKTE